MSEVMETAHGKRSPEDQTWTGARLIALLFATLAVSFVFLFVISAVKTNEWEWPLIDHEFGVHDAIPPQ
jgi:hypothetical protein